MSDIAIRVENLSKRYRIGGRKERYRLFSQIMMDNLSAPIRRLRRLGQPVPQQETIWALSDVSFNVPRGEALGIIGRNGSGKSTLLKVLSRITEPTMGRATIHGRVASLLEVGTGFHLELTGRENVYLNGAILGMRRNEIDRKFDEIVAFSGVEKFLDTPVKRYSSGMNVRLAFSVAAHLEPEILLVDEVLAVGDAEFQRKCLGKMGEVASQGRTVLFVSHNMTAIANLCPNSVQLSNGRVIAMGPSTQVIESYILDSLQNGFDIPLADRKKRNGNGALLFTAISVENSQGESVNSVASGQDFRIVLQYESADGNPLENVLVHLTFDDPLGATLVVCDSELTRARMDEIPPKGRIVCAISHLPFPPGHYPVTIHCEVRGSVADEIRDALALVVIGGDFFGTGYLPARYTAKYFIPHRWEVIPDEE